MQKKPFHESIVDLLCSTNVVGAFALPSLPMIGEILKVTLLPANHDAVIKAWEDQCIRFGHKDTMGVAESLRAQRDALLGPATAPAAPAASVPLRASAAFARRDQTAPASTARWAPTRHDNGSSH